VTISSTVSGTISAVLSSPLSNYVSIQYSSGNGISAGGSTGIVLYGNATGLSSQTYSGTLTVTVQSGSTTAQGSAQVNFVVGSGSGGGNNGGGVLVAPAALTFSADTSHVGAILPQFLSVTDAGTYSATATTSNNGNWLTLSNASGSSQGTANPALIQVTVSPSGLTAGTYTGTITVNTPNGTSQISVTLQVYNATILYASFGSAGSYNVVENAGNINGVIPTLQVLSSDNSSMSVSATSSVNWISLTSSSGNTPANFGLIFSAANLPNGVYIGTITVTGTAANSPLNIPVVLTVVGSSVTNGLSLSQNSLTLNGLVNGSSVTGQLGVTATVSTAFTATASVQSGNTNWLSVTPSGTAPQNITVTANPSGLSQGTYNGTVTVSAGGTQASAQITFVVSTNNGSGGNITTDHQGGLTFTASPGGTAPAAQTLNVTNVVSGSAAIAFTVSTSVNGGVSNWLSATTSAGGTQGLTPAAVTVSVTPGSLSTGTYTGSVTLTPSGGSAVSIPITLTVQAAPTVSATPFQLTFAYQSGGTVPAAGSIQVTGSTQGLTYSAASTTTTGGSWLQINKTSGTTPDVISVTVSPQNLAAGQSYQGTVVVKGTGNATGTTAISVVLTVTAPFPTITNVVNAATLQPGPISPGELITLFGTALGPVCSTPSQCPQTTLDANGKVSTSIGNVQVLFNGFLAPLLYVSDKQINCVVPYELAQLTLPYVQVRFLGQTSNTVNLTAAASSPGIFAVSNGTGPAAALNADSTVNGPNNKAAAGTTVQIYMTGEGQITPAGVTGSVTCRTGCATISQIPIPLLPVGATVNGGPATIVFYGEAPGIVSGVMQVNVTIPPGTPSGPANIQISVGSPKTQSGITVYVQ
jgi:uncharacterized protein (TIGR03437 family)